ncbi:hypothetical protein BGZ52_003030 [Haplosporangium bisporale]|nr:hypothetical protein BGZ52_003030 [Haplosporangium bisporale]
MDSIATGNSQNAGFESYSLPVTPTAAESRSNCLPENGFFLAVMSLYWSNLVGPRIEQIWTPRLGCPDESTLDQLSKQILNGEVMRTSDSVETKMVVLQEEGLIAMSYLYTAVPSVGDTCSYNSTTLGTTSSSLAMSTKFVLSFVVPLVYLQNFSGFFGIMSDHAPVLIEVLRGLRSGLKLNIALDLFAEEHLVPFVEDIMTMEAVAMAVEGAKTNRLYHILSSPFPTTIVDTVRCKVEQTERFPKYTALRSEYRKEQTRCVINRSVSRVNAWNASNQTSYLYQGSIPPQSFQKYAGSDAGGFWGVRRENGWTSVEWKGQKVVRPVPNAAPMVENLVRCVVGLPIEMREGYVRQWRRGLVKRALTLVKFVRKEGIDLAEQLELQARVSKQKIQDPDIITDDDTRESISAQVIFQQLGLDTSDLSIVLGTAERLLPSITEFVRVHLGVE